MFLRYQWHIVLDKKGPPKEAAVHWDVQGKRKSQLVDQMVTFIEVNASSKCSIVGEYQTKKFNKLAFFLIPIYF